MSSSSNNLYGASINFLVVAITLPPMLPDVLNDLVFEVFIVSPAIPFFLLAIAFFL